MKVVTSNAGSIKGKEVTAIRLTNESGMVVECLSIGGAITKIMVPDKNGTIENVVMAHPQATDYETNPMCLGSLIGRTSGRIHKGQVTIDGKAYQLPINNNQNTLHGGLVGLGKRVWDVVDTGVDEEGNGFVTFGYISPDGEEGFPGTVMVEVTYTLTTDNKLILSYRGKSDADTLLNMTNHTYFNLSGDGKETVLGHQLQVAATHIAEIDEECIPTGKLLDLSEAAHATYDFRTAKAVGADIASSHDQLRGGYDNPWVIEHGQDVVADYMDPTNGRRMTVSTDRQAVVIYTMNYPSGTMLAHGDVAKQYYGICFETQSLPIGYEEAFIEGSRLGAEEIYETTTCFSFSVVK